MYIFNIMTGKWTRFYLSMNETLPSLLASKLTAFAKSLRSLGL